MKQFDEIKNILLTYMKITKEKIENG